VHTFSYIFKIIEYIDGCMNTNDGKNQANADSTGQEHNVEN